MCGDLRGASSEVPAPRRQLRGQALRGTHEETGPRGRSRALEQLHVSLGRRDGSRTAAGGGRRWERRLRPRPPLSRSAETDVPEGGVRSAQAPLSGCPLRAHVLTGACSAPAGPCGRQALLDPAPGSQLWSCPRRRDSESCRDTGKSSGKAPGSALTPASSGGPVLTRNGQ